MHRGQTARSRAARHYGRDDDPLAARRLRYGLRVGLLNGGVGRFAAPRRGHANSELTLHGVRHEPASYRHAVLVGFDRDAQTALAEVAAGAGGRKQKRNGRIWQRLARFAQHLYRRVVPAVHADAIDCVIALDDADGNVRLSLCPRAHCKESQKRNPKPRRVAHGSVYNALRSRSAVKYTTVLRAASEFAQLEGEF